MYVNITVVYFINVKVIFVLVLCYFVVTYTNKD